MSINYTGKLHDGTVFDSSEGREPLRFGVGSGQVIPGFDKAVEGMELNQEKKFTIPAKEAYGPVRAEMILEIPREKLPPKPEPQAGRQLLMQSSDGQKMPVKIVKIEKGKVTLDLNHPLAGKDLQFEIKVVSINQPSPKESFCGGTCSGCHGGH